MVVFFATDFKPNPGGIAEYVHQLCRYLTGTRVVITTVPCEPPEEEIREYPVVRVPWSARPSYRTLDAFPPSRRAFSLWWASRRIRQIQRVLLAQLSEDEENTVIIASWSLVGHWVAEACRRMGLTYALIAYGNELRYPLPPRLDHVRIHDFRHAHTIMAISSYTRGIVESMGVPTERIAHVAPGISGADHAEVTPQELSDLDRELGLGDRRVLFTICRLVPRKGVDLVLRAFAELKDAFPESIYVVAGEGSEGERLEKIAGDLDLDGRVIFTGAVSHRTKCALFERCELFVMPNRNLGDRDIEGFGIVFLEAGLHGRPVIGGNNGGVVDAVIDGQTGLLVDTSTDHVPTRTALRALLEDPERAREMGRIGKERARREFGWPYIAQGFALALGQQVGGADCE